MINKIKEAREWHKDGTLLYTLKHAGWKKGIEQFQNATTIKVDGDNAEAVAETILKALSAYEKLQGVDFDLMASVYEEERAKYIGGTVYYPHNQAAFKGAMRKAIDKLVADIGGDG